MEVIFILGASQAFFLSFLVFKKASKSDGDYVLGAWLAFMGLHLLDHYFMSMGFSFRYPHLLGVGQCFPMLQGPFMFVYILVMIGKHGKFKPIYLLHGIPFLVFTIYFTFDFYILGSEEKLAYYKVLASEGSLAVSISEILNFYLGPIYVVWSLIKLRKHIKNIANNFSYTEEIDLSWIKHILIGLGFVWFVVLMTSFLDVLSLSEEWGNHLIYLSLTVAVFFLGYFGIKQQAIYVPTPAVAGASKVAETEVKAEKPTPADRYKHSGLKKEEGEEYAKKLLDYMENDRPYLNGKLSLKEVAEYLNISVNHLSQVINEQLGKSFFDFVNEYRVEEVKRLMSESKHEQFTLLAVAYDSGFNSKSSFNSIFKKMTGFTPSEYLRERAA
ncbi:AraC family transcriptional regulator [Reichenbachiella sp.]|uniref:helix-turn-helix domain-containing protein n=1 Tax=Reichenbachiella sp. TaxID=2184521 RepID=UPI003299D834